jgi:hypothetical protein
MATWHPAFVQNYVDTLKIAKYFKRDVIKVLETLIKRPEEAEEDDAAIFWESSYLS